jgi:predicted nucleic acid-binding Zn ribbon protein
VARGELTSIQELLPSVLAALARSSGSARHLKPAWDQIVGPIIARHATPLRFEEDVLVIEVTNPGWARELAERELEIRPRVAAMLGKVSKLVFRSRG